MGEETFIDFKCPHCGANLSFQPHYVGTAQGCPECLEPLVVPKESTDLGAKLPHAISTQRLLLRPFRPADWQDLLEIMSDPEMFRYNDWHPQDEDAIVKWLDAERDVRLTHTGHSFHWGFELQETQKLIGFAGLWYRDEAHLQVGFTIFVNRTFQRKGYGTEGLGGLLDFCFQGIHVHRVTADCDSRDLAAIRMLEKSGLRREGEFIESVQRQGEWLNILWHAVLRKEYDAWAPEEKTSVLHQQ
jgi:RimJ/RimL family protein N-acetyltransferase